jgi:hypothetical protein
MNKMKRIRPVTCLVLFSVIFLHFAGCSKTIQTEIPNQVCVKGPFGGTNLEKCDTVVQHDSLFDVLHIGSNQIFTMQTDKENDAYHMKMIGTKPSSEMNPKQIYDFDYYHNDLVTLQISDPDVLQVTLKSFGQPIIESIQGIEFGVIRYTCRVMLYQNHQEPVVLLEKPSIYNIEVIDNRYIAILHCEYCGEEDANNVLEIYRIEDLLNNNPQTLFSKVYQGIENSDLLFPSLESNQESLLYVSTSSGIIEVYNLTDDSVNFVDTIEFEEYEVDFKHSKFLLIQVASIPSTPYIALMMNTDSEGTVDNTIKIMDTNSLNIIDTIPTPLEGYSPYYVIPYQLDDSKGFFVFYKNMDTEKTLSIYHEVP